MSVYAVILAGGLGSRFWPLSRQLEPKQLLRVTEELTLIQSTVKRIGKLIPSRNIYIVTNQDLIFELKKQLLSFKIPEQNFLLEPQAKNTAPAIGLAALHLLSLDPKAIMVVLPSDHFIKEERKFIPTLKRAIVVARKDYLVTLGIRPTDGLQTGYGYIKISNQKPETRNQREIFNVEKFIEKPSRIQTRRLVKGKRCFWNSGMFVWKARVILEEFQVYLPALYKKLIRIKSGQDKEEVWHDIKSVSVDYGVMEKSRRVVCLALDCDWTDLGSWKALDKVLPKDKSENILKADSIDIGSRRIIVFGRAKRLIATIGLKDLIVVDTPDALLVCHKDYAQEVKGVVEELKKKERKEHFFHKTVKRPWGNYTVLDIGQRFKVKLVEVEPKRRLSLQSHSRRAEHWVVVDGEAKITHNKRTRRVCANQSIFIPQGRIHRLENPADYPLKIVEVQTGDYLEEDDIERFDDDFLRT